MKQNNRIDTIIVAIMRNTPIDITAEDFITMAQIMEDTASRDFLIQEIYEQNLYQSYSLEDLKLLAYYCHDVLMNKVSRPIFKKVLQLDIILNLFLHFQDNYKKVNLKDPSAISYDMYNTFIAPDANSFLEILIKLFQKSDNLKNKNLCKENIKKAIECEEIKEDILGVNFDQALHKIDLHEEAALYRKKHIQKQKYTYQKDMLLQWAKLPGPNQEYDCLKSYLQTGVDVPLDILRYFHTNYSVLEVIINNAKFLSDEHIRIICEGISYDQDEIDAMKETKDAEETVGIVNDHAWFSTVQYLQMMGYDHPKLEDIKQQLDGIRGISKTMKVINNPHFLKEEEKTSLEQFDALSLKILCFTSTDLPLAALKQGVEMRGNDESKLRALLKESLELKAKHSKYFELGYATNMLITKYLDNPKGLLQHLSKTDEGIVLLQNMLKGDVFKKAITYQLKQKLEKPIVDVATQVNESDLSHNDDLHSDSKTHDVLYAGEGYFFRTNETCGGIFG